MCVCVCVCVLGKDSSLGCVLGNDSGLVCVCVCVCWGRIGASCVCVGQGCKPPIGVNVSSALCLSKTLISLRGVPPLLSNSSPTRTLTPLSFTVLKPLTLRLVTLLFHHLQTLVFSFCKQFSDVEQTLDFFFFFLVLSR